MTLNNAGRLAQEMSDLYTRYVNEHKKFYVGKAKKRLSASGTPKLDLRGIEAFSYKNLLDAVSELEPEQRAIQECIANKIGDLQGDLAKLSKKNELIGKKGTNNLKIARELVHGATKAANKMLALLQDLPTKPNQQGLSGHPRRVEEVAKAITDSTTDLFHQLFQDRDQYQFFIARKDKKSKSYFQTTASAPLKTLYSALMDGVSKALSHTYEYLLSARVGRMPADIEKTIIKELSTPTTKTKSLRGGSSEIIATMNWTVNPRELGYKFPDRDENPLYYKGTTGLIDWFVRGDEVGLNFDMAVSQKEYFPPEVGESKMAVKAIATNINNMIIRVSDNVQQAYALYRAFASKQSRGKKTGATGFLAEAIMRETIFESIFGIGNDQITDLLINRVFYSAEAIVDKLFSGIDIYSGSGRFFVEVEGDGAGTSSGPYHDEVAQARATESGATEVWVSADRLKKIQKANFVTHWYFDTTWFTVQ